jgi:protease-4
MPWPWRRKTRRTLARVTIEGPIAGPTRKRVLKALRQVQERECPALLLRIDSPGGTVGDSQEIHAAIGRLRQQGCRVVASFGNIAASGGVYLGVAAEKIVANPGTITGSIGVILRGNNLSKLLERIGVSFETVKSGLYKDILSPDRALTAAERELLQSLIDSSYAQFVAAVAEGRGLSEAAVRGFADGRVFSGAQARDLGLVDELGAEETARRLA